ncbi:MAG: hypothetical protein R3C58_08420 [Parvularculaceae bacterium]
MKFESVLFLVAILWLAFVSYPKETMSGAANRAASPEHAAPASEPDGQTQDLAYNG